MQNVEGMQVEEMVYLDRLAQTTHSEECVSLCAQVQLINGPEIISKYLGESERNLRQVLAS